MISQILNADEQWEVRVAGWCLFNKVASWWWCVFGLYEYYVLVYGAWWSGLFFLVFNLTFCFSSWPTFWQAESSNSKRWFFVALLSTFATMPREGSELHFKVESCGFAKKSIRFWQSLVAWHHQVCWRFLITIFTCPPLHKSRSLFKIEGEEKTKGHHNHLM